MKIANSSQCSQSSRRAGELASFSVSVVGFRCGAVSAAESLQRQYRAFLARAFPRRIDSLVSSPASGPSSPSSGPRAARSTDHRLDSAPQTQRGCHPVELPRSAAAHWEPPRRSVSQVWRKAGLQPHRLRPYMASNDPDFEAKAADVIGLYLNPPVNAAVFSVDEKSAIQALTGSTLSCRSRPAVPNVTASNISVTALSRSTPPSRAHRPGGWQRPPPVTPAPSLLPFWSTSVATQPADKEIHIIVPTTFPLIRPSESLAVSAPSILTSLSTTPQPTLPGSTRSKSGSRRSSVT